MRNAFIRALEQYAQPDTVLIVGDLGFGVVDGFRKKYPKQFLNAGVAEQNMTGLATGLALSGKKVFTYSIANFPTLRTLEQIRNGVAYHELNVTVVCVGGGLAYGALGISHHATEDLAILRAIPNMTVLAPGDTVETFELTRQIIQRNLGPVYLRLGRAGEATLHTQRSIRSLQIGKALPLVLDNAANLAILSTGGMLAVASELRKLLLDSHLRASIYSFHTLKPFDRETVREIFRTYPYIISLEEHARVGGFSSAILEALVGLSAVDLDRYVPFALPDSFTSHVGDQAYLRDYYGISARRIYEKVRRVFKPVEKWKVAV